MGQIWDKFYRQEPMKYYQPLDYNVAKAQDLITGKIAALALQKFDGEWCRIIKDDNGMVAQSRTISKVTGEYGDKTELIPHIMAEVNELPNGTVLLGELCWRDITKTSKDVGAILRCKAAKAIERQKTDKLVYRVFDCLAWGGTDLSDKPYKERFEYVVAAHTCLNIPFSYILPPIYVCDSFEDFLQEILSQGGEGIVIHSADYKYAPGKRPAWSTLKVKKITTELELLVTSSIEPKRLYEGTEIDTWKYWIGHYEDTHEAPVLLNHAPGNIDKEAGLIWEPVTKPYYYCWKNGVVVDNNGTMVRVTSGLTDEDREWLATAEAKIAIASKQLYAVVSAMEVTEDGSLRHPRLVRLRTDMEN